MVLNGKLVWDQSDDIVPLLFLPLLINLFKPPHHTTPIIQFQIIFHDNLLSLKSMLFKKFSAVLSPTAFLLIAIIQ